MKDGLLLLQLGTPNALTKKAVRDYLKAFLGDPLVLDMPAFFRWALLYGAILPFRTPKTFALYQKIWTEQGSPLRVHSQSLQKNCQSEAPPQLTVALGMRYGEPSIEQAVETLKHCDRITVLPLFPQYAQSSSETALKKASEALKPYFAANDIYYIQHFCQHPAFIHALAEQIKDYSHQNWEHLLFSFHGIPKHHLPNCSQSACLKNDTPCSRVNETALCYKSQCFETARTCAQYLNLDEPYWSVAFQSRLGRAAWIGPELNQHLKVLRERGITRLAVSAPSFVGDCLETLEELDIRAKESWLALGGTHFERIPCLNDHPLWVKSVLQIAAETFT